MSTIVPKPWGREIIITTPDLPYTGKIIEINAGQELSLQYHDQKIETLALITGEGKVIIQDQEQNMIPYESYTIKPPTIHRLIAITNCQIVEVSTPEVGTTHRLQDDYHRPDETK